MLDQGRFEKIASGEAFFDDGSSTDNRSMSKTGVFNDIRLWDVEELLNLRSEIDKLLPSTKLKDMDLETELILQYHKIVALQTRVLDDNKTPANQMAQVSNAVAGILQNLVAMQTKYHTSERFKELESRLIKTLNRLPPEYLDEFFKWYESEAVE